MNPITIGSLVKIVDPSESMSGLDVVISKSRSFDNIGQSGIILSEYEHRTSVSNLVWYTVIVQGIPKAFREDYLELL